VIAYATTAELTAFLADGNDQVPDAERLLLRASEMLDDKVRFPFAIDTQGLPTVARVKDAMRDACCAQVEFWLEVGEEHDIEGLGGRQVSVGHLNVAALPDELARRARRILHTAGLFGIDDPAALDPLAVL
jgi:hypothetical protein